MSKSKKHNSQSSQRSLEDQADEAGTKRRWWEKYQTYVGIVATAVLGLLGWGLIQLVIVPLSHIPGHTVQLAKLEKLPDDLKSFRAETREEAGKLRDRVDNLSTSLARIDAIPPRMDSIAAEVAKTDASLEKASRAASLAAEQVTSAAEKMGAIETAIEKSQAKIDGLKPIGDSLKKAEEALARLEAIKQQRQTATTVAVQLRDGQDAGTSGKHRLVRFVISTSEIPVLSDPMRIRAASIAVSELRSRKQIDSPLPFTVDPNLDAEEGRLDLVVYFPADQPSAVAAPDLYVLLTVSWPVR